MLEKFSSCFDVLFFLSHHGGNSRVFFFSRHYFSVEILQYCKNIYKTVRKVSKILQEPCNDRLKHYKCNVGEILIFHFNIPVM